MDISLDHPRWPALRGVLEDMGGLVVAVSGGVDSLLLATLAHAALPGRTLMAHAASPAVPQADTERVRQQAHVQGWSLAVVTTGEFEDEMYLNNPYDRCYFCKSHLYKKLQGLSRDMAKEFGSPAIVTSGANTDDLGEHRPGLQAAKENGVRHPFVEAGISKAGIRTMCRELQLPFAELPASPCLSSRLYTGTKVTAQRLEAVAFAEDYLKKRLGADVVRCRICNDAMLVELEPGHIAQAPPSLTCDLKHQLEGRFPCVASVVMDPEGYRPGRAFKQT